MKDTQNYLNEVRARVEKATEGPWTTANCAAWSNDEYVAEADLSCDISFIAASRTDVPKLLKMIERAVDALKKVHSEAEIFYNQQSKTGHPFVGFVVEQEIRCQRALSDIEQIARGCNCRETINGHVVCLNCREVTGDAEMDRFASALATTPLKNTENV